MGVDEEGGAEPCTHGGSPTDEIGDASEEPSGRVRFIGELGRVIEGSAFS